jgi:hypothetical protein
VILLAIYKVFWFLGTTLPNAWLQNDPLREEFTHLASSLATGKF